MKNSNSKGRVVIAGGSGFLGKALAGALVEEDYEVVVLTRDPAAYEGPGTAVRWDGRTVEESWVTHLEGAHALVNLTGKSL